MPRQIPAQKLELQNVKIKIQAASKVLATKKVISLETFTKLNTNV